MLFPKSVILVTVDHFSVPGHSSSVRNSNTVTSPQKHLDKAVGLKAGAGT